MSFLLLQSFVLLSVSAPSAWELVERRKDGVTVERREVPGTRFPEFRITAESTGDPGAVLERAWRGRPGSVEAKLLKEQRILNETATTRLVYASVKTPVVSDRDYVMYFERVSQESPETRTVNFWTRQDVGPPPQPRHVRVPYVRGSWVLSPSVSGGTRIIYTCVMDPGGGLPVWLTIGPQTRLAIDMVTELVRDTSVKGTSQMQASRRPVAEVQQ